MQSSTSREPLYQSLELQPPERSKPDDDSISDQPDSKHAAISDSRLEKVAIKRDRGKSLLWSCVVLAPVAVSFGILQLSFRQVFWRDAQEPGTSTILEVLQVGAKAHELLIIFSLSQLVLYYLRQQLNTSQGLPFGLFASGYAFTLGSFPASSGFWLSWKLVAWKKRFQWKPFGLACLVILAALIGLTASPASAILLIPQLKWWYFSDLFMFRGSHTPSNECYPENALKADFALYIPKPLFPNEVDASSLPGPFCLDGSLDVNSTCPFKGLDDILPQLNWTGPNNMTIGSGLGRIVASTGGSDNIQGPGVAAYLPPSAMAWTTNQLLGNYMANGLGLSIGSDSSIHTIEAKAPGSRLMSPIGNVTCEVRSSTASNRNLTFLVDTEYLGGPQFGWHDNDRLLGGQYDIRELWNETVLKTPPSTMFEWKEFQDTEGNWLLAGFILVPKDKNGRANVSMCSVRATWAPNEMYVLPAETKTVVSNFTFDDYESLNDIMHHGRSTMYDRPEMVLRKSWADALNAANGTSNSTSNSTTVLTKFLDAGMRSYSAEVNPATDGDWPGYGQSLLLATAVANGLAAIGLEFNQNATACRGGWCSSGPFFDTNLGHMLYNSTMKDAYGNCPSTTYQHNIYVNATSDQQMLVSFKEPDTATRKAQWTKLAFPIKMYGYGWGFNTVTVKIATAVLLLHAVVILTHVCIMVVSGRSYSYASYLDELIALALQSRPTKVFRSGADAAAGEGKSDWKQGGAWSRKTAVRQVSRNEYEVDHLELVVSDVFEKDGVPRRRKSVEEVDDDYI